MDCQMYSLGQYVRVPHCSLCGQKFDRHAIFRAVIFIDNQFSTISITQPITFEADSQTVYLDDQGIQIHRYPRRKARYAPSVHSLCEAVGIDLPSPRTLYDLGLAMTPLVWTGLPQDIYRSYVLSEATHPLLGASHGSEGESMLLELLKRCGRLPVELSALIWDYIPSGTIRCLLALNAAKKIWSSIPLAAGSATISLYGRLVVYFTHLIKGTYICGIRQGSTLYGHESSSCVEILVPASITACVFSLGTYGLQKIEFLTSIGASSTDMDNTTQDGNRFIRLIPCPSNGPPRVDVDWDIWKISLANSHEMTFGHNFYWVPPVPYNQLCWLNPRLFYDWPRHFDFATQRQRFMTYIPLRRERRLYGLTAFCSNQGFVGLGTHFCSRSYSAAPDQSSAYWYGQQHGCPIHIQFDCSDGITAVHVYWHQSDRLSGPYLAIETIKNRVFFLGPHFPPSETVTRSIVTLNDGEIHGLYYDMTPGILGIKSLGAICRPYGSVAEKKHSQQRIIPEMPPTSGVMSLLMASPFTSFTSQAYLKDIASVKACYLGSCCTGMLLCYNNDERCVLGQWYENTEVQADIQEISLQSCDTLRFYFSHHENRQRLISVKARSATAPVETGVMFVDIVYGEEIVWMFSGQSDLIFCGSD